MEDIARRDLYACSHENYMQNNLSIVVIGASGDLAKKKTYPTLFDLFSHGYIPNHCIIAGYARSSMTFEAFRIMIRPFLKGDQDKVDAFLSKCVYFNGQYDSIESFSELDINLKNLETSSEIQKECCNRLFYFAIPPNVFIDTASSIKSACRTQGGWNRLIVEKPFGSSLASALRMSNQLMSIWTEQEVYRIDHYLGKEMVQNLIIFRFANTFLEPLLNSNYVKAVRITFKEDFGTMGRGGYFDNYGIIRDIMQNHLMQVLTLVAMEAPVTVAGSNFANHIRDAKVNVLKAISPLSLGDVVLGQYVANDKGDVGYLDDPTVPRGSITPTFAQAVFHIHTPRWEGVPFIMKAGKALEERKGEIRIQFKDAPAARFMFDGVVVPRNELVLRLQPSEAVYFKVNVKSPGLFSSMEQTELDLSYASRYKGVYSPDAYARLILDCLNGSQAAFVRSDELEEAWKIFDPLLTEMETKQVVPDPYPYGSRGPKAADLRSFQEGYQRNDDYHWNAK